MYLTDHLCAPRLLFVRALLFASLLGLLLLACTGAPRFEPSEATLEDVRRDVRTGAISCRALALRYQQLRDTLNPRLRAIVTWNDRLLEDADRLDRIAVGQRGPFHCVPLVVKDNIDVAGLPTTGGARALSGSTPGAHAAVTQRLLDAGAIVLGKANLPDFALDGINTLSSAGGQTVNPYNPSLTVYGSSGGTAAAISASLGLIGLGTDTFGSLVQPASATGLVSLRPTQDLVPGRGVLPLMTLQDTVGPMTRTVEDAAATLELLVDPQYAAQGSQEYTRALVRDGLRGLRIGFDPVLLQELPAPPLVPSAEVSALFNQALARIGQAGATTKQVNALASLFPALLPVTNSLFACMPVDFKQGINQYLGALGPGAPVRSLTELIATHQYLDTVSDFLTAAEATQDTLQSSAVCQQYLTDKAAAASAVTAFMDEQGLDLLVYPAANQPPFPIGQPPAGWYGFQGLSSPTGLPSLTLPMGIAPTSGAPVGLIFLARKYQEALLLQAAYAFQEQARPRVPPPQR